MSGLGRLNGHAAHDGFIEIQAAHPDQVPLDRTGLNSWDSQRVVDWVKATGRKKLVMAGLWTEICLAMPVLSTLAEGYQVYIVTDASGGASVEAHERAVQRMIQAGARPITAVAYLSELQRDWKYDKTADNVVNLSVEAEALLVRASAGCGN